MKTFILPWDPATSQYGFEQFEADFDNIEFGSFRWILPQNSRVRSGDNLYVVKCGEGTQGIVMKGFFTTGVRKGRGKCWAEFRPTFMIHPGNGVSFVPIDSLAGIIPEGPLSQGEILLSPDAAMAVGALWDSCVSRFPEDDDVCMHMRRNNRPAAEVDDAVAIIAEELYDMKDEDGNALILRVLREGLAGCSQTDIICGFLRDLVHINSYYTVGRLRERGFSEEVADRLSMSEV